LSGAFSFPTEAFYETACRGGFAREVRAAAASAGFPASAVAAQLRPAAGDYSGFESDYIASFEVGTAGPPCPLYAGPYIGGRNQVWEELIRFYNLFGLHLSPDNRDLPDHISTELEFMHFLCWKELALKEEAAAASVRRAQRDFLRRQLSPWLGPLSQRAEKKSVPILYRRLISFTRDFVLWDLESLANIGHSALDDVTIGAKR